MKRKNKLALKASATSLAAVWLHLHPAAAIEDSARLLGTRSQRRAAKTVAS